MNTRNYTTTLNFLWAVGQVTPSAEIVTHRFRTKTVRIMVDAGITPGSKNHLMIPKGIDMLLLSHGHTDHVGALPRFYIQNPTSHILVPKWNYEIVRHNVQESWRLSTEEDPESKMQRWLNDARWFLDDVRLSFPRIWVKKGRKWRTQETMNVHDRRLFLQEEEDVHESSIQRLCDFIDIDFTETADYNDKEMIPFLQKSIDDCYRRKLKKLKEQGLITKKDVDKSLSAIQEFTVGSFHKVMKIGEKNIWVRFDPTGHLVTWPACSIGLELPGSRWVTKILFSGDLGNPKLGYPGTAPDYSELYDSFDTLVLESTYGGKIHPDRGDEMRKLDARILNAVHNGIDINVITLALERPVNVLYEILRCLENNHINPRTIDISYFWDSIGTLFKHFPKGEIYDTVKPFLNSLCQSWSKPAEKARSLKKLGQKWNKIRIIISSAWFFPEEWPSAWLLENLYPQEELLIISPNFHGEPGSNGHNLFNKKRYRIKGETFDPKPGHILFKAGGFSGHGDAEHLTRFARKTLKKHWGAKVFLNHWSDESREALTYRLQKDPVIQSKKAIVVSPKAHRKYKATK